MIDKITQFFIGAMLGLILMIVLTDFIQARWEKYDAGTGLYTMSMELVLDSFPSIEFNGLTYDGDTAESGYVWVHGDRPDYVMYESAYIYYCSRLVDKPVYTEITKRRTRRK